MSDTPLEHAPATQKRIGPFWLEEGLPAFVVGLAIVAAALFAYGIAFVTRPQIG